MEIREDKEIVQHDLINLLMQAKKGKLSEDGNLADTKKCLNDDDLAAQ